MENKEKQGKNKKILLLIAVVLAAVALLTGGIFATVKLLGGSEAQAEAPEYVLYWNVDREQYIDKESGLSKREKDPSDGLFHITLACKGEQEVILVKEKKLVNKIDGLDLMGLVFDEEGLVTEVIDVEDCTGGTVMNWYFVQSLDGSQVTLNSSKTFMGIEEKITLTEGLRIYDVSEDAALVGEITELRFMDQLVGVVNSSQELTHLYIRKRAYSGISKNYYCDHCQEKVDWHEWSRVDDLPMTEGHFYLVNDVNMATGQSVEVGHSVILDLNGKTVTAVEDRYVYILREEASYLAIMDYSPNADGRLQNKGSVSLNGGVLNVTTGQIDLYAGVVDASGSVNNRTGGAIYVGTQGLFNMYGGTVIGTSTIASIRSDTLKPAYGAGGSVYILGTFAMYGGEIRDGKTVGMLHDDTFSRGYGGNIVIASSGVANLHAGKILNGTSDGPGGNVYMDGVCIIGEDMEISGGKTLQSGKNGGNIYVSGSATLTMNGGSISNGHANAGGNIATSGVTTINGGTITGGTSIKDGGNVTVTKGTVTMADCVIDGNVYVSKNGDVLLGGKLVITGGKEYNLKLATDAVVDPSKLTEGADIGVTASGYFTDTTEAAFGTYFHADIDGSVFYYNSKLFLGKRHCLCGGTDQHNERYCDGTKLLWKPWISKESMPSATGNYYLTKNIQLKKRAYVGSVNKEARNINLDLNGRTITGGKNANVVFVTYPGSSLSICDTSKKGTGTISGNGVYGENGMVLYGGSGTTINLYSGTITGGTVQAQMKATTASDGTVTEKVSYGQGGNVFTYGTFNMYGGTVTGGTALSYYDEQKATYSNGQGGNVYIPSKAVMNFYGGTITGGTADGGGGNLYNAGTVTMEEGAVIENGKVLQASKYGGNVYVAGSSQMDMNGGTVVGGSATSNGGNFMVYGTLNITGGSITGGTTQGLGGNVNVAATGTAVVSGGVISGGMARTVKNEDGSYAVGENSASANICVHDRAALELSGGQVAGYIRVANGGTLKLSGTPMVTGGEAGLSLGGSVIAAIDGVLTEGTVIDVASDSSDGYFAATQNGENAAFFKAGEGVVIIYDEQKQMLQIVSEAEANAHKHCICGGCAAHTGCSNVTWQPISGQVSSLASGYYYLEGPVNLTASVTIGSGKNVYICLNGNTITAADGARAFLVNSGGKLHIADCKGTGKVTGNVEKASANMNGGLIFVMNGTLELYGGTLESKNTNAAKSQDGGTVRVGNTATNTGVFLMYGGTVIGGSANRGGSIYVRSGRFEMYGGRVTGGTAGTAGNNVFIQNAAEAQAKLSGGQITGGVWLDGATAKLTVAGSVNITGAENTYNLQLAQGAILQIEGTLAENAQIGITLAQEDAFFAATAIAENAAAFTYDQGGKTAQHDAAENKLYFAAEN